MPYGLSSWMLMLALSSPGTAASRTSFPFRLIDNLVVLPVSVNGRTGWATVDSGTSGIVIDRTFARGAGVARGRFLGNVGGSGSVARPMWRTTVNELKMPSLRLRRVSGEILDTTSFTKSAGFPDNVTIGPAFFRNRVVAIDYPSRTITVTSGPAARLRCERPIPFTLMEGAPVIEAKASFDGGKSFQTLRLMVDTGTRHQALLLDEHFLATPAGIRLRREAAFGTVANGVGGPVSGWSSTGASLAMGSRSYRNIAYAASFQLGKSPYDGFLGVPFWRTGTIAFDYDRRLICLTGAMPS